MDVLAVPVTCGSGNLWVTSNFSYKPIQIEVFEATRQTAALAEKEWKTHGSLKTQRTAKDFKNQTIRTEPELKPDPNYEPDYVNFPIEWKDIEVAFTSEELQSDLAIPRHATETRTKRSSARCSSIGTWRTGRSTACAGTTNAQSALR